MPTEPPSHLRLLWVPILMALIAAAVVTLRGCDLNRAPATAARESGRR
jgi:hypothetical protein